MFCGNSDFRSFSIIFTFFEPDNPHLFANLDICVSTGNAGSLKHLLTITDAVLCPTPRSCSSSRNVFGTVPLCFNNILFDVSKMARAFELKNPHGLMISLMRSSPSDIIFSGESHIANNFLVTLFTMASVH